MRYARRHFGVVLKLRGIFSLVVLIWLSAAGPLAQAAQFEEEQGGPTVPARRPQQLSKHGQLDLRSRLDTLELTEHTEPAAVSYSREAHEFYASLLYGLAWIEEGRPTRQAWQVVAELQGAAAKGLLPEDYGGPLWAARFLSFDTDGPRSEDYLIEFDVDLTLAAMRFVSDLRQGRVNPQSLHFAFDAHGKSLDLSRFVERELLNADDPRAVMESIEPQFLAYRRTLQALEEYRKLETRGDGDPVPSAALPIHPGEFCECVPHLAKRLVLLGDLRDDPSAEKLTKYDDRLVEAVKRFQARHGIEPDGVLDVATVTQLNTPIGRRITQLQLTLERWRWLPQNFERPPIVVNLPEYRLHLIDEAHRIISSMNVVVGKAYHHETPVFVTEVEGITFRPYWYVPLEIQRKELVPLIEKNAGYLQENAYEILDRHGRVQEESEVSEDVLNKLKNGELVLRQRPGPDNSLGLMKLEMPNPYDIYLHGTPAPELFAKARRDFSHGCIRVEDPARLALWVLRDTPGWSAERIRSAMNGSETMRVNVKAPVPVWVVYGTAVVLEDGHVRFFDDIYGHDIELERALAQRPPLLFFETNSRSRL